MISKKAKTYIAGHTGLIGAELVRQLNSREYSNLIFEASKNLNLENKEAVRAYFEANRPEYVYLVAASKGGGIRVQQVSC